MSSRCALITIFNHKFERNIPRLEEIHTSRFTTRKYIVPFAESDYPGVISVIANGGAFGQHIAQAGPSFISDEIDFYIFAGDDLILNPRLNETNFVAELGLDERTGYIKSIASSDVLRYGFMWSAHAGYCLRTPWMKWQSELPSRQEAEAKFKAMGLQVGDRSPRPRGRQDVAWTLDQLRRWRYLFLVNLMMTGQRANYPLQAGYADFLVVPRAAIARFVHYCGVLAATEMQAEIAVPTAMALACDRLRTELPPGQHFLDGVPGMPRLSKADRRLRDGAAEKVRWKGCELWGSDIARFEEENAHSLDALFEKFPSDRLYVHPVKLSRWT